MWEVFSVEERVFIFIIFTEYAHGNLVCSESMHSQGLCFLKNMNFSVMLQLILTQVSAVTNKEENM
jgi:hypothetical protein